VALPQLPTLLQRQDAWGAESFVSGPGRLIALAPVTALAPLALQLQTRQKDILPGCPYFPVERADRPHQLRIFQAPISQELPRPSPVLLFHMRVIVRVVGSRTGKFHRVLSFPHIGP